MKKCLKFLMAAVVVLIAVNASAQIDVKVGFVSSNIKEKYDGETWDPGAFSGSKIGVDYNIALDTKGFALRPGLNYTFLNKSEKEDGAKASMTYHLVNVPVDLKYQYSFNDDFGIYAVAGPRIVVGISAIEKYKDGSDKYTINAYTGKWKEKEDGQTESGKDKEEAYLNRFDIQLGVGIGLQYRAVSLEFGYDWGLLNGLKKDYADGAKWSRNQLGITLGYAF